MESDSDSYFEESSSEGEQEGALHLNVEVNIEEAPESPPLQTESPPILPQPVPVGELAPVWELPNDGTNFLNYFTRTDVLEFKSWAVETRAWMNEDNYVVESPVVSQSYWAFLQHFHGKQWEAKFLQPAAGPLFDQMLAYIAGYARLTSLNKSLFRQNFEGWSAAERAENLRFLAESGGFLELE